MADILSVALQQNRRQPSVMPADVGVRTNKDMNRDCNDGESQGCLDGSPEGMRRFLGDLAELASQDDSAHTAPVLELQFGEVLTRTSVCKRDAVDCLVILLVLPPCEPEKLSPTTLFPDDPFAAEILWHAEEGRHVIVRHLPVAAFKDEPAVFDTVMASADQVTAWLADDTQRHLRTVGER